MSLHQDMSLAGVRILVVDDEEDLRDAIMALFAMKGAHTTGAENGTVAFELLQRNSFDVVFSDVRMPGGAGTELLVNIQSKLNYRPKVFLCTGFADITVEEAKALGAIDIIPKPFEMKEIIPMIEEAVRGTSLATS